MNGVDFNINHGAWVLVADSEKAIILENAGDDDNRNFRVFRDIDQDHVPARVETGTEVHGTNPTSPLTEPDWHRLSHNGFAKDAAELLYRYAHRNRYKELVLVAAPNVLGQIRKALHKEVSSKVVGELPKVLTNHPVPVIESILNGKGGTLAL